MVAKKSQPVATTTAPVTPVAPAPVKEGKEVAKPKATAKKTVAEPTPVKSVEKVTETVAVEDAVVETESPLDVVFAKLTAATALFKEIQTSLKTLQKTYEKMKKVVDKQEKKKANARTTPSGFAKPTKISDELCSFLDVPKGTELSRTQVTRNLNLYIKEKNLYDQTNRRIILPDANMKKILNLTPGEALSFFTLQKAIKHHFAPSVKA